MKIVETIFSDRHKQSLSQSAKGRKKSPEHKARISEAMKAAWERRKRAKS